MNAASGTAWTGLDANLNERKDEYVKLTCSAASACCSATMAGRPHGTRLGYRVKVSERLSFSQSDLLS